MMNQIELWKWRSEGIPKEVPHRVCEIRFRQEKCDSNWRYKSLFKSASPVIEYCCKFHYEEEQIALKLQYNPREYFKHFGCYPGWVV